MVRRRPVTLKERKYIRKQQANHCKTCPRFLDLREFHVDHVVPLADGGSDTFDNKQALCITCHLKKTRIETSRRMMGSIKLSAREREFLGMDVKWIAPAK